MIIEKIIIENFKVYYGTHEIDCTVMDNLKKPLILIGGPNGAGKTSILEAVKLCLFGALNKQLLQHYGKTYGKLLSKLHNTTALNQNMDFSIAIEYSEKKLRGVDIFRIERKWKLNNEKYYDEELNLYANDEIRSDIHPSDFQLEINEIFPIGVCELLLFDSEMYNRIPNYLENGFIHSLNKFMGIDVYNQLHQDLSMVKRSHIAKHDSKIELKLEENQNSIEETEKKVVSEKGKLDSLIYDNETSQKMIGEIEANLKKQSGQIALFQKEIEQERSDTKAKLASSKNDYKRFLSERMPLLIVSNLCDDFLGQIEMEITKKNNLAVHKEMLNFRKIIIPFIKSEVSINSYSKIEKKWDELETYKKSKRRIIHDLSITDSANFKSKINSYLKNAKLDFDKIKSDIIKFYSHERAIMVRQKAYNPKGPGAELFDKLNNTIRKIESNKNKINNHKTIIDDLSKKLDYLKLNEISILNKSNLKNIDAKKSELIEKTSKMLIEFSSSITKVRFNKLKKVFLKTHSLLATKKDKVNDLIIDHEKRKMYFIGQNGNKLDINDFSAGESELVSFSLLWAVNETADINYPIITDSPFNRLDKTHRKNFINNILKKSKSQLIFLSTDEEISNIDEYELEPYIENTFLIKHNKKTSNSKIIEAYF